MKSKILFGIIVAVFMGVSAAIGERTDEVRSVRSYKDSQFEVLSKTGVPQLINYQGYLTDANGPITGTLDMTFTIWDVETGGTTPLWSETQHVVVDNGLFNVLLGSDNDITCNVFSNPECWLQIKIGNETLSPRKRMASVGYAFRADTADYAVASSTDNDWTIDGDDIYREVGNVGIGTTSPSYKLDVTGPINLNKGSTGVALRVDGVEALWYNGSYFSWGYGGTGNYFADNVGIGTTNPQEKLHVSGRARFDLGTGQINMSTPGGWPGIIAYSPNGNRKDITIYDHHMCFTVSNSSSPPPSTSGIAISENGNVGIGTGPSWPSEKLDVNGTTKTNVLKITGGSDIAEPFDVEEADVIKAGMVLTIDPENPGKLKICEEAYDRCVAGIVSGAGDVNPGMIMGQSGSMADGKYLVALTGRVYCWADASNGPIEPGDLLTTSDRSGHAMKVVDYDRAQGAIIGKAMSSLEEGQGLVLVLVTLQ